MQKENSFFFAFPSSKHSKTAFGRCLKNSPDNLKSMGCQESMVQILHFSLYYQNFSCKIIGSITKNYLCNKLLSSAILSWMDMAVRGRLFYFTNIGNMAQRVTFYIDGFIGGCRNKTHNGAISQKIRQKCRRWQNNYKFRHFIKNYFVPLHAKSDRLWL